MAQLILTVPYEPTCGPISGLQGAGEREHDALRDNIDL